jgi:hypothetical protein
MPDDTRPTFGQALEQASAAAGAPSDAAASSGSPETAGNSGDPAGSSPALTTSSDPAPLATAATQPGAGDGTVPQPIEEWDASLGPIPVDRHKAILENTRTRAREEAQQALQEQYGWALNVGPQNFQALTQLASQWANDPVNFVLGALDDLVASPQYAPALRSHVAKLLARRPQSGNGAQPVELTEPQPDIVVDGHRWYSAEKMQERDRWLANKLLTDLRTEMAPLREDMAARQERETIEAATHAANRFASDTITTMNRLPYFKEQKAEIEKVFRAMPPMPDQLVGQAIRDAYIQVLTSKVLPTLSNAAKSDLLSSLNQKAAASVRNPGNGAVAVAARPKTFEEALRQAEANQRR